MATAYDLKGSYPTVQSISDTVALAIEYCTIATKPGGFIVNYPVPLDEFNKGTAGPILTSLANGVEDIYNRGNCIAAVGTQSLDAAGLLQDFVTYTVVYVPPGSSGTSITAEADVPVGLLSESDVTISETLLDEAEAIIQKVYNNLKATSDG